MAFWRRAGPYRPNTQLFGGIPDIVPDVLVSAVLLFLFLVLGMTSIGIFIHNKKKGRKFIINGAIFGLCKIRMGTFSLRIAWACHPTSVSLGIASTIFVYAGIIILFVINFVFAQRIVRAQHRIFGWSTSFLVGFISLLAITVLTLIAVIVAALQSFFTLDPSLHRIHRGIQRYGLTCFAVMAFLPTPIVLVSTIAAHLPSIQSKCRSTPPTNFGPGRMQAKVWICTAASVLLTLGAAFRAGTSFLPPTPILVLGPPPPDGRALFEPTPWYLAKASFYAFNFATELAVIAIWLLFRVDRRFFVPERASRVYHGPKEQPASARRAAV